MREQELEIVDLTAEEMAMVGGGEQIEEMVVIGRRPPGGETLQFVPSYGGGGGGNRGFGGGGSGWGGQPASPPQQNNPTHCQNGQSAATAGGALTFIGNALRTTGSIGRFIPLLAVQGVAFGLQISGGALLLGGAVVALNGCRSND